MPAISRQDERRPMLSLSTKKKENKQILNNYRPVSLLPICRNLFEKIIFDTIFQHLTVNKLVNLIQISQASCLEILVYISLFQLPMRYIPHLMLILY